MKEEDELKEIIEDVMKGIKSSNVINIVPGLEELLKIDRRDRADRMDIRGLVAVLSKIKNLSSFTENRILHILKTYAPYIDSHHADITLLLYPQMDAKPNIVVNAFILCIFNFYDLAATFDLSCQTSLYSNIKDVIMDVINHIATQSYYEVASTKSITSRCELFYRKIRQLKNSKRTQMMDKIGLYFHDVVTVCDVAHKLECHRLGIPTSQSSTSASLKDAKEYVCSGCCNCSKCKAADPLIKLINKASMNGTS